MSGFGARLLLRANHEERLIAPRRALLVRPCPFRSHRLSRAARQLFRILQIARETEPQGRLAAVLGPDRIHVDRGTGIGSPNSDDFPPAVVVLLGFR